MKLVAMQEKDRKAKTLFDALQCSYTSRLAG